MIEAVPLARAELKISRVHNVGATPRGVRTIAEVSEARFQGERFNAKQVGAAAADWSVTRPDGVTEVDVRISLQTEDGALVFLRYDGYFDAERGAFPIVSIMRFETSDERYAWLNRVQAVGKGRFTDGAVRYEIFELR
jgi:hypothetical protein